MRFFQNEKGVFHFGEIWDKIRSRSISLKRGRLINQKPLFFERGLELCLGYGAILWRFGYFLRLLLGCLFPDKKYLPVLSVHSC